MIVKLWRLMKMGTMTLSVPDKLKHRMEKTDWVNWSSVARHAFIETLEDVEELQLRKKIRGISEIDEGDARKVKDSVAREAVKTAEKAAGELRSGRKKSMSLRKFNKWCEGL